ncbi:MAG TPA: glycosyltransferase family 2 protein, partial [Oscillatoriaceae cyanobacterium]
MGCRTAIVIVNWNTRTLLLACLESVRRFASEAEVWVVDNASHDGSAEAVRTQFPEVRLIANAENAGFARANNQAIRKSTAPYVWLLNPDTELREGALEALEAVLDADPHTAVVGSGLLNPDGSPQPCSFAFPTPFSSFAEWLLLPRPLARTRDRLLGLTPRRDAGPTDWVLGASLLVRRTAIDAVGLLDEGYFMYSEELDWCHRFRQAGHDVRLAPDSVVVHHGGASTRQMPERMLIELFKSRARSFGLRRSPRAEARFTR